MADTPTPRSYNQILGEMLSRFLSKLGLKSLPVGDPVLSIMEAAAQSDLRSSQDIFSMLASTSLDQAEGTALFAIGASENVPPLPAVAASGVVTITDTRFQRISSSLYHGAAAPIAGSYTLALSDGSNFPSSGSLYIGRNTPNYEGPLTYSSVSQTGGYWTVTLTTPTTRHHNSGEEVVLAQGGDRGIPAGTTVQTPQGNVQNAIRFSTLFGATLADGEVELEGVQVVASQTGKQTNISANAITSFSSLPFPGASVTNPLPFTNGRSAETPEEYRERIRQARQSRSRGTVLAIEHALQGATAVDESKRIASVKVISGNIARVIIDDGNGYEESSLGVALEVLSDGAQGGEKYFELAGNKPIAPAMLMSESRAPFDVRAGDVLSVQVGTTTTTHLFSKNLQSAYDIVSDINANALLNWVASTADSGRRVRLTPKTEDAIKSIASPSTLALPRGEMQALFLYKNDRLLSRDGAGATLSSISFGSWAPLSNGETLDLDIDGTGVRTYTFTASHFVGTGFTSVDVNSPSAWATAINAAIPGVTATSDSGRVYITSNRGSTSNASLEITGGSLVTNGVFQIGFSRGSTKDYTLDRSTGQIELTEPLATGDILTAGTATPLSFWESAEIETVQLTSDAVAYVVVDSPYEAVELDLTPGDTVTITKDATTTTIDGGGTAFVNVRVGDTLIVTGNEFDVQNRNRWTVASATNNQIVVYSTDTTAESVSLASLESLVVVRTSGHVQKVILPAPAQHTAVSIASELSSQLQGASAEEVGNTAYRIYSSTPGGSVSVITGNAEALAAGLVPSSGTVSSVPTATVKSSYVSSPKFSLSSVSTYVTPTTDNVTLVDTVSAEAGDTASWLTAIESSPTSPPNGWSTYIEDVTGNDLSIPEEDRPWGGWVGVSIHSSLSLGPNSELAVTLDGDQTGKRYVVPLSRRLQPTSTVYGVTNLFNDLDNGGQSLAEAFGLDGDFTRFKALMPARAVTSAGTDHAILWRYKQPGKVGEAARVSLQYGLPGDAVKVVSEPRTTPDDIVDVRVHLPGGTPKPAPVMGTGAQVGFWAASSMSGGTTELRLRTGLGAISATRFSGVVTVSLSSPTPPGGTGHGVGVGDTIYVNIPSANFGPGPFVVSGVTASSISYAEAGIDDSIVGPGMAVRLGSSASSWTAASPAPVVGDVVTFGPNSGVPGIIQGISCVVSGVTATQLIVQAPLDATSLTDTEWDWNVVVDPADFAFASNPVIDTDTLVAAVNADTTSPVTATNVSGGNGNITLSTQDEEGVDGHMLEDGENVVSVSVASDSPTYELTFTRPVSSTLAGLTDIDWQNETVTIVPGDMEGLVRWLNYDAASNLHNNATVALTANSQLLITSNTPGSKGSVSVEGGKGSALSLPVKGGIAVWGQNVIATVPSANATDLVGGQVRLVNQQPVARSMLALGTTVTVTSGVVTLSGATPPNVESVSNLSIVKDQNLMAAYLSGSWDSGAFVSPGDYVKIDGATGTNVGPHRILGAQTSGSLSAIWFEADGVEEFLASTDVITSSKYSPQVGDKLIVNGSILGGSKTYVISAVNNDGTFTTNPALPNGTATITVPGQVRIIQSEPSSYIKTVLSVNPTQNPLYSEVKMAGTEGTEIGESAGGLIVALGRLNVPAGNNSGVDSYRESTGLMAEAGRILFGVSDDPATYPGVVAAGAKVSLSGPLIRKVAVSVSVRARAGVSISDIRSRIQSAVAAVINDSPVGRNIAISEVVSAITDVNGVTAVTVLNPTYGPGEDLILVQPDEKAMVLDLNDVSVSFAGV